MMEAQPCADHDMYKFSILMLPWLAHGHVSPYLELAKRLSRRHNILVYMCSTPINLDSIREHVKNYNNIRLVELHLPSLLGLPPQLHTTKYLPSHLMPTLKNTFDLAEPSFCRLLDDLQPDLLIYDFLQPWAPLSAQSRGIPAVHFMTTGAAAASFFCHYLMKEGSYPFPFQAIGFGGHRQDVQYMTSTLTKSVATDEKALTDRERLLHSVQRSSGFIIIKSFREIEFKFIDYFSSLTGKEVIPVGPLVPDDTDNVEELEQEIMRWLSKKDTRSVVFVSFGSEYFMSEEEMMELAHGLELSKANFIWVVRFPTKEQEESDRRGFMERVGKERGMVVEGWAPQRSILAHPSLGAFLTHCGWSSVMEGMRLGVPMIALPLHNDQPLNAKLLVELGVGVLINNQLGKFKGSDVAKGIRDVLLTKKGDGVRAKAKEMAEIMCRRGDEEEIKLVVEKMAALCSDNANKRRCPQFARN